MKRQQLCEKLVAWDDDPRKTSAALREFPHDCEESLATLRKADVAAALNRFLSGEVSSSDIEAWADAVEMRDDIGYEESDRDAIANTLFILSNPDINGVLTPDYAKELLVELGHAV